MTSPSPLLYDTYYHIYNRGTNRENIFIEERNYALFLNLFEKHVLPVVDVFAYCMMKNHFHMAVRVKSEEEVLESIKTLKVSTPNTKYDRQEPFLEPDDRSPGKPLGFENYASRQFSNFFNAYATRSGSTKPMGGQVVYSSILSDASRSRRTCNSGM